MIKFETKHIATVLAGELLGECVEFVGVSIDSRTLIAGNLYVAIEGVSLDGHQFVVQAKQAGAAAAIVHRKIDIDIPQIIVENTTIALGQLAKYWRQQFSIPFIGITGSCGKTTTTQMTGAIFNQMGLTLVPEGNKNNQFGVPLTLFRLSAEHQFAVIEMGADRPSEIKYLADIVQPDIALITNVAPVHLQVTNDIGFNNIEGVFAEKSEIYKALSKEGVAIVCADDVFYPKWCKMLEKHKRISFGCVENADVYAKHLQANQQMQYSFDLVTPAGETHIQLSSLGRHNVINALAASAVALSANVPLEAIRAGLANVPTVARRMIRIEAKKDAVLIDDSYNSNLKSAMAVLDMLADHQGKTIAILGDMLEIGEQSEMFHRQIGEHAKQLGIDHLLAFGPESKAMAIEFGAKADHYTDYKQLLNEAELLLTEDTLIVVKGSLGMGMDRIVKGLTKEDK